MRKKEGEKERKKVRKKNRQTEKKKERTYTGIVVCVSYSCLCVKGRSHSYSVHNFWYKTSLIYYFKYGIGSSVRKKFLGA